MTTATKNATVELTKTELVIRLPRLAPTLSASGKSFTIASTRGNLETDETVDGKPLVIGVNAYYRAR